MTPADSEAVPVDATVHVHPDIPLEDALPLLAGTAVVPVVTRARPYKLLGTLTLEDVHRAFGIHGLSADEEDGAGG
jgi:CBS domain-containing protein